jgi:hypothetical protein
MKTTPAVLICAALLAAALLFGATVAGYQDWTLRPTAPGNPASGNLRVYADSATGKLKCLNGAGTACVFDTGAPASLSQTITGPANPNGGGLGPLISPANMTADNVPAPFVATSFGPCTGYMADPGIQGGNPPGNFGSAWQPFSPGAGGTNSINFNSTCGGAAGVYLDLGAGNAQVLFSYQIMGATDWVNASAWTVQGSNNATAWTTIDTQTNQQTWTAGLFNNYVLSTSPAGYRYLLIYFTAPVTAGYNGRISVSQISFYGLAAPFTGGNPGDVYFSTLSKQFWGPRPTGPTPTWPLLGTLN